MNFSINKLLFILVLFITVSCGGDKKVEEKDPKTKKLNTRSSLKADDFFNSSELGLLDEICSNIDVITNEYNHTYANTNKVFKFQSFYKECKDDKKKTQENEIELKMIKDHFEKYYFVNSAISSKIFFSEVYSSKQGLTKDFCESFKNNKSQINPALDYRNELKMLRYIELTKDLASKIAITPCPSNNQHICINNQMLLRINKNSNIYEVKELNDVHFENKDYATKGMVKKQFWASSKNCGNSKETETLEVEFKYIK